MAAGTVSGSGISFNCRISLEGRAAVRSFGPEFWIYKNIDYIA